MGDLKAKTVGDLISALNKLDKSLPIVYSVDAEGNHFDYIHFDPCIGYMQVDGDFTDVRHQDKSKLQGIKVVCIN